MAQTCPICGQPVTGKRRTTCSDKCYHVLVRQRGGQKPVSAERQKLYKLRHKLKRLRENTAVQEFRPYEKLGLKKAVQAMAYPRGAGWCRKCGTLTVIDLKLKTCGMCLHGDPDRGLVLGDPMDTFYMAVRPAKVGRVLGVVYHEEG